jgi:ferredoxin
VASERARLEAERDAALAAAEARHGREMEQAVSAVAERVVSNIAAGLLDLQSLGGAASVHPVAATAVMPGTADAARPPVAVAAPEADDTEEEDPLGLDEAYIETPRCTTCNECTAINSMMFAYNRERQAYIKDASAGPYRDLVMAAEKCPVRIIHPGKPLNAGEVGLDDLTERAKPFM